MSVMTPEPATPVDPFRAAAIRVARQTGIALRVRVDEQQWAGWTDEGAALRLLTDACEAAEALANRVPMLRETHASWTTAFARTADQRVHRRARAGVVHLERLIRTARRPVVGDGRSRFVGELDECVVTAP